MKILGISGLYHDSSAAIIENSIVLAASHEERYTRKKQDNQFPINSIGQVLTNSKTSLEEIEKIIWYEKPNIKLQRSNKILIDTWPFNYGAFFELMSTPLITQDYITNLIKNKLNWRGQIEFVSHHESHMASAVFGKRGEGKTLALTVDGIGEFETATAYIFDYQKQNVPPIKVWSMEYPNSIGLFYSAVTQLLGFEVNEGEYKVMGLAPYGVPKYLDTLKSGALASNSTSLNPVFADGFINWGHQSLAYGAKLKRLLGLDTNNLNFQDKADIAASVQKFLEHLLIEILDQLIAIHKPKFLRMAGGVALNCTANSAIIRRFNLPLDIQPAAGDAGNAIGAALFASYYSGEWKNENAPSEYPTLIGSEVASENELNQFIKTLARDYTVSPTSAEEVAQFLSEGKVIGVARGRAEFGPRALGNRAILASPLTKDMKDHLNAAIKFREQFRPFAPVVCEDDFDKYFERLPGGCSRNMLLTVQSKLPDEIPAVTHVDNSSRVQELNKELNPFLWDTLKHFGNLTGTPVLTLTSFNLKGEPIVQNHEDAFNTFIRCGIDVLVIENLKFLKPKT